MRKDEVVTSESHRFLSEKRKASRIGHHGRGHQVLVTCYTPGAFRLGEGAGVSSLAFERFRQVDPTVEKGSIFSPNAKEPAVGIILHSVRHLQSGSGDELRPFASPGMILRNSGKLESAHKATPQLVHSSKNFQGAIKMMSGSA